MTRIFERRRDSFRISTNASELDVPMIVSFLKRSYWARALPESVLVSSIENALPFGLYDERTGQIGFARVITDYARFAFLSDVFVLETYRGKGLGVWLVETVLGHPQLQSIVRWHLGTDDAQGLYEKFGFKTIDEPYRYMNRLRSEQS